jgi:hypothetical protein
MDILNLEDLVPGEFARLKRPIREFSGVQHMAPMTRYPSGLVQPIGFTHGINPITQERELAQAYIIRGDGESYIGVRICSSGILRLNRYFRRQD